MLAASIIVLNVVKECLTGTLGVFVLVFAQRLKVVINNLVYHWGNSPPQVERIKLIRLFLTVISITFLLADIVYNMIGPTFDAYAAVTETRLGVFGDALVMANGKVQLMTDIKMQFVLFLNLQILFFHHALRFGENTAIIDMGDADNDPAVGQDVAGRDGAGGSGSRSTN